MSLPVPAMLYTQGFGSRPENVEIPVATTRSPGPFDAKFPIGKNWVNITNNSFHTLTSFSTSQGVTSAQWSPASLVLMGTCTMVTNGTVTVTNPLILATSFGMFSCFNQSGEIASWSIGIAAGSLTISSLNPGDQSSFFYFVFNP